MLARTDCQLAHLFVAVTGVHRSARPLWLEIIADRIELAAHAEAVREERDRHAALRKTRAARRQALEHVFRFAVRATNSRPHTSQAILCTPTRGALGGNPSRAAHEKLRGPLSPN